MSKKEGRPIFVSPDFRRAMANLFYALEHPEYYSESFPAKKRYLFFGQAKLDKERQLQTLLEPYADKYDIRDLVLDIDQKVTIQRLTTLNIKSDTIVVIHNLHFLLYGLKDATIQKFAYGLKNLPNAIIGISDIPVDPNNMFYAQFEEFALAVTPTLEHLEGTFKYYFSEFEQQIQTHNLNINLNISNEDCLWLAQQSSHCHDADVHEFVIRVYHFCLEQIRLENDPVTITRGTLEDLNNGFMYAIDRDGVLTITQREAIKEQNVYSSMAQLSVQPRKRGRE